MEHLTTLYHNFMVQNRKMFTYDILEENIHRIDNRIQVDTLEDNEVTFLFSGTHLEEEVLDEIYDEIYTYSKSDEKDFFIANIKIIDGVLLITINCSLIENEDERDIDELKQADREEAEFETYREKQLGVF